MSIRPNILWFITDQQSASMLSCAGNPYVRTPNMDYLAHHGVRFNNAYCTNPVCAPSRFSMMTGLYPGAVGIKSNAYAKECRGLPQFILDNPLGKMLNDNGYNAVYGGVEHIPFMDSRALGFDYICEDERDLLAERCSKYILDYNDDKPYAMIASFGNPHDICLMAIDDFAHLSENESDKRLTELMPLAVETMRKAAALPEGMNPDVFFECVCPPLPHNYLPAEDEPEAISILQNQRGFKRLARENYTDEQWRVHRWAYARLTEMVDAQIGRVLDAVIRSGTWDNTVIILTSDHGDMDSSHKMEHKTALYQECCKVPMIVKGLSRNTQNIADDSLVSSGLDCICTVLDYAGVERPEYMEGLTLKPNAEGAPPVEARQTLIVESEFGHMTVDQRYKYVRYSCGARREQFYDLDVNIGEQYNQIEWECYTDELERLRGTLPPE